MKSRSKSVKVPMRPRSRGLKKAETKVTPAEPPRPRIPVPPGFQQALQAQQSLMQYLRENQEGYFGVNIQVRDNQWILQYRGQRSIELQVWEGLEIQQIPARIGAVSGVVK